MNETVVIGRRQFLRDASGALVAIPFLASLLPRSARAGEAARPKNFVAMITEHGGMWHENMFPADAMLGESRSYAGHTISRGDLVVSSEDGEDVLSPVLKANAGRLSSSLVSKMNVIAGFDYPFEPGHHPGGELGNYAANEGNHLPEDAVPTIDQVLAYSPGFYGNSGFLRRSLLFGAHQRHSYYWEIPSTKSGQIQGLQPTLDTLQAFDSIYVPPENEPSVRRPVVDRIFESYQRIMQGSRRLSTSDRRRLTAYMDHVGELQRRLTVAVDCGSLLGPTANAHELWGYGGVANSVASLRAINDVIVAALMCGTCRVAVVGTEGESLLFSDWVGEWHGAAHDAAVPGNMVGSAGLDQENAEELLVEAHQRFFAEGFVDLASKLDFDDGSGQTLLDDTLLMWTQEAGSATHDQRSVPVVTAGSAGGALRTGSYIDYRERDANWSFNGGGPRYPGLLWPQWLGTVLETLGVPRTEFESPLYQPYRHPGSGTGGYGPLRFGVPGWALIDEVESHYTGQLSVLGEIPPYLQP